MLSNAYQLLPDLVEHNSERCVTCFDPSEHVARDLSSVAVETSDG